VPESSNINLILAIVLQIPPDSIAHRSMSTSRVFLSPFIKTQMETHLTFYLFIYLSISLEFIYLDMFILLKYILGMIPYWCIERFLILLYSCLILPSKEGGSRVQVMHPPLLGIKDGSNFFLFMHHITKSNQTDFSKTLVKSHWYNTQKFSTSPPFIQRDTLNLQVFKSPSKTQIKVMDLIQVWQCMPVIPALRKVK
jgi:hypothetical protein